jgi:hypothetical protein
MKDIITRLLYPRFEVIANYPLSPYKIGDIIDKSIAQEILSDGSEDPEYFRTYVAAFREKAWHEDRSLSDMLEIRFIETTISSYYIPGVQKKVLYFRYDGLETLHPQFKCFVVESNKGGIVEVYPNQCKPITNIKPYEL